MATTKTNIRSILRGVKPARMQTVGNMQVIPLILDMEPDERFAAPDGLTISNRTYGHVNLKNQKEKAVIVPTHATYLTKQKAQDHALMSAAFVKSKGATDVNTAACVQSSQGGQIRAEETPLDILPFAIRESALEKRKTNEYGKIWSDIGRFNRMLNISGNDHLEYFTERYKDVMDQFVAEFEILPKQIGAIVLIDGVVHGVERAPNAEYWRAVWEPLIRMCYGSQAIYLREKGGKKGTIPVQVPLKTKGVNTLAKLKKSLEEAEAKERENAATAVRKLIEDDFKESKEDSFSIDGAKLDLVTLKNDQFCGQMVREGDRISYASMVTTQNWQGKRAWEEAREFKI